MKGYLSYNKNNVVNILLLLLLSATAIFISIAISKMGSNAGILILCCLMGVFSLAASFFYPDFGFYNCIFLGFIISVAERILYGIITLDFVIEILIYATFAGIVFKKFAKGESIWDNTRHPINYVFLIYFVFLLIEVVNPNASSVSGALFFLRKTIELFVLYLVALNILDSYKKIRFFFYFWIVISALCGLYGCYQQWIGFTGFELRWIKADDIRVAIYSLDNGSFRKFSSLTDPAAYGILMGCSGLMALMFILEGPFKLKKIALVVALTFLLLGMAFSGTRTATFAVLAGVSLYLLMRINNVKTLALVVLFVLALGFLMFAPIYGNVTINRLRSTFKFSQDNSYEVRNTNRASIQPYIWSHPIGGGVMTTGTIGQKYNPGHYLAGFPSDSGLLKTALEYGWVGLILVCLLYFVILQQGTHFFYRTKKPFIKMFLLAAIVPLFGNILSQYSQVAIGASPEIFLFYPLIAIIVRISKLETKKTENV